jgi:hypothetical protein
MVVSSITGYVRELSMATGIVATRSMAGWNLNAVRSLPESSMTPFVLMTINSTGRFQQDDCEAELFLQGAGGGVAAVGGGFNSLSTAYGNLFHGSVIYSLTDEDIPELGWAINRGRLELARQYAGVANDTFPQGGRWWEGTARMFNLIGDPATRLWRGNPTQIDLQCEESINLGANLFEARVVRRAGGEAVAGAKVCLYYPQSLQVTEFTDDQWHRKDKPPSRGFRSR